MSEATRILAAVLAGMLLGVFFFGGLWWTVRQSAVVPAGGAVVFGQLSGENRGHTDRILFRRAG